MKKKRFIILGDTHFCTHDIRGGYKGNSSLAELPDYVRYADMVESVLKPMFSRIRSFKPDFVISTGDFVEGGMKDKNKTYREMKEGWRLIKSLKCPVIIAKGTHEGSGTSIGAEAYRKTVMPEISGLKGVEGQKEYFIFRKNNCVFFILDYLDYHLGNEQDIWLEAELRKASGKAERIFIVAHPPLYNWGRHFFNEPEFIRRITRLCRKYPVDAYLCGHTHNQVLSYHETGKGKGFMQVTGSSVGYPNMDLRALDEFHVPARFTVKDKLIWGIHEDSSPGFHLIEINNNDRMNIEWHSFKSDKASVVIETRRSRPSEITAPEYRRYEKKMSDIDMRQIKSGILYIYGSYQNKNTEISVNDISLGELPPNTTYAARRFITFTPEVLKTISKENKIRVKLPEKGDFTFGSLSLEFLLLDNRIIHSAVSPELFVCGERWKEFQKPRSLVKVKNEQTVSLTIKV
ncbi:MAG: hypothetical protein A2017_08300 [Lentisphaerae bacterium GWF2_44_16]|nr:MAG: hypothetical protein A2017_08300 [Lentisphaerae bacterium GWF2_44_16]